MKFIGNVLATIVGIFVFIMLFFVGIMLIGTLFGGDKDTVTVEENSVLELDLEEVSKDYAENLNVVDFSMMSSNEHNGLIDILNAIDAAKTDEDIKGISILNSHSGLGLAQATALRKKIEEFKKSKKFVVAYADMYSQKEYYICSVADTIYLNPVGVLEFQGLSTEVLYMKELQNKIGVKMEVIRHGKYKSAVEPYLTQEMSPENRLQLSELLNSAWSSIASDVAKSRKINIDTLNNIATRLGGRNPKLALQNKLIDKIGYEDEYHDGIRKALKKKKTEKYTSVSIVDYANKVATTAKDYKKKDKIAVVFAQGEITGGEGSIEEIGEGYMRTSLQEAREDKNVKAIVLRIDSPGGSALTSELIWREIERTKKVKPVVVSMGNVAASGGYYIACNSNYIFAEPTTITGSIGVFGMIPNGTDLAKNIGVNAEQVSTHNNKADYGFFDPLDEKLRAVITEGVEDVYKTFVTRVATGRKMTFAQVDAIGQGRIWTGIEAQKNGLVDKLGGLEEAIKYAATLGKTKEYRTINYPEFEKTFDEIFKNFEKMPFAKTKEQLLKEELGKETYEMYQQIKKLQNSKGIQARMPYELLIK